MVRLEPMSEGTFAVYLERATREYAAEKVRAGNYQLEGALQRAEEEHRRLIPDGMHTVGHHFFSIFPEGGDVSVGMVWFMEDRAARHPGVFIYNFEIDPPHQRKGYAAAALGALEAMVREMGLEEIRLHVFGHNAPAIALYQKMGFQATNINMAKHLPPDGGEQ